MVLLSFGWVCAQAKEAYGVRPKAVVIQRRSSNIKVKLKFIPVDTGVTVKVYTVPLELAPDAGQITIESLSKPMEYTNLVYDSMSTKRGGLIAFAMVVENNSNEPQYFYAVSHTVEPPEAALGFKLGCLCNNHIFEVPAKSRWTRLGSLALTAMAPGPSITFVHKIIGLTNSQLKAKKL